MRPRPGPVGWREAASLSILGSRPYWFTMRPSILFPLFAETRTLPGVGPKVEKLIARVAGTKVVDLMFDLPVGVMDRSYRPSLIDAEPGRIVTVTVNVLDHVPSRDQRRPYRVRCSDDTALIDLVFFHGHSDYLNKTLPVGAKRIISGRIEKFRDQLQMAHPDFIVAPEQASELPLHEPVYALTEDLAAKNLTKAIRAALEKLPRNAGMAGRGISGRRRLAFLPRCDAGSARA